MHFRPAFRVLLPLLVALVLAACHGNQTAQAGGSTPEAAVQALIDRLKANDLDGLWKQALPPDDYATLRADWRLHGTNRPPASATDKARFDAAMQQLTGPDAETRLYAEVQPKLVRMQQQYSDQAPVLIAMGGAFLKHNVAQNPNLDATQKAQVAELIDVLTPWAQQAPWFDQAKAKQAIAVLVATARRLNLRAPEQLRTMDFDAAMAKYGTVFAGFKQVLALYGLSVDDVLDTVKLSTVSNRDGRAVVKIDCTLLGKPLSLETDLVQLGGRWYSAALIDDVRKAHAQWQQPAASGSATAH
ncbi:MAG: hypothetical protein RSP_02420 [Rhodanobacter sp.]